MTFFAPSATPVLAKGNPTYTSYRLLSTTSIKVLGYLFTKSLSIFFILLLLFTNSLALLLGVF